MTTSSPFRYRERAPAATVAPWVLTLWAFEADATPDAQAPYTVWPDGCLSVGFALLPDGAWMTVCTGPRVRSMQPPVRAGSRLVGVRFWPDAIGPALGVRAADLRDVMGPAPSPVARWCADAPASLPRGRWEADEAMRALEGWLAGRLAAAAPPDAAVRQAVRAIVEARGDIRMEEVARVAGLGLRQLQRRFPAATGLTLREWARVRRLREALGRRLALPDPTWSRIAAETGFVDHAHLTREFVALTGLVPRGVGAALARTAHDGVTP